MDDFGEDFTDDDFLSNLTGVFTSNPTPPSKSFNVGNYENYIKNLTGMGSPAGGTTADGTSGYSSMSSADIDKLLSDPVFSTAGGSLFDQGISALKGALPDLAKKLTGAAGDKLKKLLVNEKDGSLNIGALAAGGIGGAALIPLLQKLFGGEGSAAAPTNSYVSPFAGTKAAPAAAPTFVQMPSQAQSYQSMLGRGMAQGGEVGMKSGGFVVPADVVSHLGNGSTNAGVAALKKRYPNAHHIQGHGDGMSDDIPATIDGQEPARVADGEVYIEGADNKGLKSLMANVRKARTGTTKQAKAINPARMMKA